MLKVLLYCCLVLLAGCSSDEGTAYRVAFDPSWYPQDFMGKEPSISGFSEDVLREAGNRENFSVQLSKAGPEYLEWGLNQGKWDAILTSLSPAVNYEGRYYFSDPYLQIGPVIVVPASSLIQGLPDLAGKTVAVQRGSSAVSILASQVPDIVIVAYDSPALALELLLAGQYEAVSMPVIRAGSYVTDLYSDRLKIVTKPLNEEALRLVSLTSQEHFIEEFNDGLDDIQGRYYNTLLAEWHITQPSS